MKVGLTLSLTDFQPQPGGEEQAAREWENTFLHYLPAIEHDDFLGVQNYMRKLIGAEGFLPIPPGGKRTRMGFEYYPRSVGNVLRKLAESLKLPLMSAGGRRKRKSDHGGRLRCSATSTGR